MITEEQIAKVRTAAEAEGEDPDAAEKMAREIDAKEAGAERPAAKPSAPSTSPASPATPSKFFMWHMPFIRVSELRQSLGLTAALPDDDMTCTEYMAEHAVSPSPAAPTAEAEPVE